MNDLVVELCGLPGSGKSTVAQKACEALIRCGVSATVVDQPISAAAPRALRVRRRATAAARAAGRNPGTAAAVVADIAAVRQRSPRDTASMIVQWLAVCDLVSRSRRAAGVHLLQEGLLQTMWSLMLRSEDEPSPRLVTSVSTTARSDVVIVLDVEIPLIQSRLMQRHSRHSRTQQLPPALMRAELERGQQLLDSLIGAHPAPVVRLSGSVAGTSSQELAGTLVERLLPWIDRANISLGPSAS
jgi:hypothetical protein